MHMRGLVLCAATVTLIINIGVRDHADRRRFAVVRSVEVSRFHPDPIAAIEQAEREAAEV